MIIPNIYALPEILSASDNDYFIIADSSDNFNNKKILKSNVITDDVSNSYKLPIASETSLGGIKVGSGLSIDSSGVLTSIGGGTNIIDITYEDLKTLCDSSTLSKGQLYKITDYQTKYVIPMTNLEINTGFIEPLIVQAIDINKISYDAKSEQYPQDIIHYNIDDNSCEDGTFNSLLQRWEGGTLRTGKIYYREDTILKLITYYDWRNVKFRRWKVDALAFNSGTTYQKNDLVKGSNGNIYISKFNNNTGNTNPANDNVNWCIWLNLNTIQYWSWTSNSNEFNMGAANTNNLIISGDYQDYFTFTFLDDLNNSSGIPLSYGYTYNNILINGLDFYYIINNIGINNFGYNNIVLLDSIYNVHESNFFDLNSINNTIETEFYGNKIGNNFNYNTIGNNFNYNTIGNSFQNNIIDDYFNTNTIGNNFNYNTIGNNFNYNTIGNSFQNNIIDDYFNTNTIGNYFNTNTIGNSFQNNIIDDYFNANTIGNYFQSNTIGNNFYGNTIGYGFYGNTIRNNFYGNTIGNYFNTNTIGNYFYGNTIGDYFNTNTIGNYFQSNTIGDYFNTNTIGNYFYGNTIGNSYTMNDVMNNISGLDFTTSTFVYNEYSKTIFINSNSNYKLSYYDENDNLKIIDATL